MIAPGATRTVVRGIYNLSQRHAGENTAASVSLKAASLATLAHAPSKASNGPKKTPSRKAIAPKRPLPPKTREIKDFDQGVAAIKLALENAPGLGVRHSLMQALLKGALWAPRKVDLAKLEQVLVDWRKAGLPLVPWSMTAITKLYSGNVTGVQGACPFAALRMLSDPQRTGVSPQAVDLELLLDQFARFAQYKRAGNYKRSQVVNAECGPVPFETGILGTLGLFEVYHLGPPTKRAISTAIIACTNLGTKLGLDAAWKLLQEVEQNESLESLQTRLLRMRFYQGEFKAPSGPEQSLKNALHSLSNAVEMEPPSSKQRSAHTLLKPLRTWDVARAVNSLRAAAITVNDKSVRDMSREIFEQSLGNFGIVHHVEVFTKQTAARAQREMMRQSKPQ